MPNCYHACLIVALLLPSLPYTQSSSRQNNKDKAPWFHLIFTSPLSSGWEIPHSSFTHLSSGLLPLPHSLSVFLIWSQVCWQQAFCSLYWQTFFPTFFNHWLFSSYSSIYFTKVFVNKTPSTPYLLSTSDSHLKSRLEVFKAETVSRLTFIYVYLSSKSPSFKPQSPITVTNIGVSEKVLAY